MTSLLFLTGFLPACLLVWKYTERKPWANIVLVGLSWLFYSWMSWQSMIVLLVVTIWIWAAGQNTMDKTHFVLDIAFLAAVFLYFRLAADWNPIGLSFYLFSAISYVADVYMGKAQPNKSFVQLALYLSFFGKILQGPVSAYTQLEPQLAARTSQPGQGMMRFITGLAKKVLIADNLAVLTTSLQQETTMLSAWLLAIAWSFQLYYDFSGYSDMAIGVGHMFGFDIPENFSHPYLAESVQDFWRRWHISLTLWFRNYIYIPLGGNRTHYVRNVLIVWLFTGLWHGFSLHFVLWGLYWAALLLGFHYAKQKRIPGPVWVSRTVVFVLAAIGWVLFFSGSSQEALVRLGRMIGIGAAGIADGMTFFWLRTYFLLLAVCVLFAGGLWETLQTRIASMRQGRWILLGMYGLLLLASMAGLISNTMQAFLYAAF